jgi:hypothetical protein
MKESCDKRTEPRECLGQQALGEEIEKEKLYMCVKRIVKIQVQCSEDLTESHLINLF